MEYIQHAFLGPVGGLRSDGFLSAAFETCEGHPSQETKGVPEWDDRDPSLPRDCLHKPRDGTESH